MSFNKSYIVIIFLFLASCKKENSDTPINQDYVNEGLDCATCPSVSHPFETLVEETVTTTTCDDFTTDPWPDIGTFFEFEILGFTEGGTQPVIVGDGGICEFGIEPGMYINGMVVFSFDDSDQEARFLVYGNDEFFGEVGFYFNGSGLQYLDGGFPFTFGGVTVDIDYSAPPVFGWSSVYLTFTGTIEEVGMLGFESGITELCVTKTTFVIDPPVIDKTQTIYFDDFYDYSGTVTGSYPNQKTPRGYYGLQGATMSIDFKEYMGYSPTRIGFVHASSGESDYLVNVQINDSPLIITVSDSLDYFLKPYGYRATVYSNAAGLMWVNTIDAPISGANVDSIIITGNNMNKVKLGVDLDASELRNVCSYYEQ